MLAYFLNHPNESLSKQNSITTHKKNSQKKLATNIKKDIPPIVPRLPAKTNISSTKKLESFRRKKISWISENLYIVEGLSATYKKDPSITPAFYQGGFFLYEEELIEGTEVIFNAEKNKYGVYSQEITFKGNTNSILEFLKSTSWEILYRNDMLNTIIVRVEKIEDGLILNEFKNPPEFQWKLGIIYSRPIRK